MKNREQIIEELYNGSVAFISNPGVKNYTKNISDNIKITAKIMDNGSDGFVIGAKDTVADEIIIVETCNPRDLKAVRNKIEEVVDYTLKQI